MSARLILIFVLLTLSGCVFISGPKHNLEFSEIESINQISGTYINKGEPGLLLSGILFGWSSFISNTGQGMIDHSEIELIQVSVAGNNITVSAIRNECAVHSQVFVLHRDFEIKNGKIQVSKESALLARGAGDVTLGPSYSKEELGLDSDQDAKFRRTQSFAVLAFLIIPVAGYGKEDYRFERTSSDAVYNTCESG